MSAIVVLLFMGGAFGLPCLLLHRSLRGMEIPVPDWAPWLIWALLMLALLAIPLESAALTDHFRNHLGR